MVSGVLSDLAPGLLLVVALMWLAIIIATLILPFTMLSIASSLRGIQREMAHARTAGAPAPVVPQQAAPIDHGTHAPRDLGHQLLR